MKQNLKMLAGRGLCLVLVLQMFACSENPVTVNEAAVNAKSSIEAGKYLVQIGGCNDCHTVGYMEVDGNLPVEQWLTGNPVGFRGPWGTTFPPNLRLFIDETAEDDFVVIAKTRKVKPPMPWPSLNKMSESDIRSIYRFIKSLGPTGTRAPEYVFPEDEPEYPYIVFDPVHMERLSALPTSRQ